MKSSEEKKGIEALIEAGELTIGKVYSPIIRLNSGKKYEIGTGKIIKIKQKSNLKNVIGDIISFRWVIRK